MGNDKKTASDEYRNRKLKGFFGANWRRWSNYKVVWGRKKKTDIGIDRKRKGWAGLWKPVSWNWTKKKKIGAAIGAGVIVTASILAFPQLTNLMEDIIPLKWDIPQLPAIPQLNSVTQKTGEFALEPPKLPVAHLNPERQAWAWEYDLETWNDPEKVKLREEEKGWYRFCRDENRRNGMEASANLWQSRLDACFKREKSMDDWKKMRAATQSRYFNVGQTKEVGRPLEQERVSGKDLLQNTKIEPLSPGGGEKEECP